MKKILVLMFFLSSIGFGYEVPPGLQDGTIIVKTKDGNETKFDANKWKVVPRTDKKPSAIASTKCCPRVVEKPCPECSPCPTCPVPVETVRQPEPNYNRLSLVFSIPTDAMDREKYETDGEYEAGVTPVSLVYTRDFTEHLHGNIGYAFSKPNFVLLGGGLNF
jgi:hypothetical protein